MRAGFTVGLAGSAVRGFSRGVVRGMVGACVLCVLTTAGAATAQQTAPAAKRAEQAKERPRIVAPGRYIGALGTSSVHVQPRVRDADVGLNGRLWVSHPIVNRPGMDGPRPEDRTCDEPGAFRYGAPGEELRSAYVRVGLLSIGISPWQRIEPRGLKNLEQARNKWLADRGYTGGVRTIRNDALHMPEHAQDEGHASHANVSNEGATQSDSDTLTASPARTIEPRATFRVQPETPRFRKRMQVRTPFGSGNWVLAPNECTKATVGPSVATVRGERSAGVTMVLPRGMSAASVVAQAKASNAEGATRMVTSTAGQPNATSAEARPADEAVRADRTGKTEATTATEAAATQTRAATDASPQASAG
jgi:hypothetical protein